MEACARALILGTFPLPALLADSSDGSHTDGYTREHPEDRDELWNTEVVSVESLDPSQQQDADRQHHKGVDADVRVVDCM